MKQEIKYIGIVGILLAIVMIALFVNVNQPQVSESIKSFESVDEMKEFLEESREEFNQGYGLFDSFSGIGKIAVADIAVASTSTVGESARNDGASANDYSETNIQVKGVDEPDIVKNDGKYIYTLTQGKVVIVDAYPARGMEVVSEIEFDDYARNIFINKDKLIVFTQGSINVPYEGENIKDENQIESAKIASSDVLFPEPGYRGGESATKVLIYDIDDRANPVFEREIVGSGNYFDARMIDDYVYVVTNQYVQIDNPIMPYYEVAGKGARMDVSELRYYDYPDYSFQFTGVMAIEIDGDDFNREVFLTGNTQGLYVSDRNIYLVQQKKVDNSEYFEDFVVDSLLPLLPVEEIEKIEKIMDSEDNKYQRQKKILAVVFGYSEDIEEGKGEFDSNLEEAVLEYQFRIAKEREKSVIHKIGIDEGEIGYDSRGEVPGHILNQFSMDEFDGNFRIATTTGNLWEGNSLNHLFVMDGKMSVIGSVEDLAKGEKIYSARFMGDRAYMVTFKKVDPFYVIDLSKPQNPKVLGYLKIPGYSDYLHPFGENHVIGIGKEAIDASDDVVNGRGLDFAWYQGLKISIFDVTDVENPIESGKIVIGDRGTESYALHDHKAFLLDEERGIMVLPISLAELDEEKLTEQYNGDVPTWVRGESVWQGAYVLNIEDGDIRVRGRITHYGDGDEFNNWYYGGLKAVQRTLWMDDILYTVSGSKVMAHDIDSIDEVGYVNLPIEEPRPYKERYY